MTPENKLKAIAIIDVELNAGSSRCGNEYLYIKAFERLRDLIQPPEEAEEIRRLKARIDELEAEADARSKEIYDLHTALSKAENRQLSKEEAEQLCDKAWDLTP